MTAPARGTAPGPRRERARVVVTHPAATLYGSDRMALETVRGLLDAGADVLLLTGEDGPLLDAASVLGARTRVVPTSMLRKSAFTPRGLLPFTLRFLVGSGRAARLLRAARPDVVYVSTLTTPGWLLVARALRIPVVCHVHEAEGTAAVVVLRVLAAPLLAADVLLFNSQFCRQTMEQVLPRLRGRSQLVLNGVLGTRHAHPRERAWSPGLPLRLLFLGRLSERKGVLVALEALRVLRRRGVDAHLDLVGDVFAEHVDMADKLDATIGDDLAAHVRRHGFDADVWPHLAACDVLLVPSVLPESFGNTAVEGILAARPVVGSDLGGLPEALAGYAAARLVPPGDAEALADAALTAAATEPETAAADARVAAARHDPETYRRRVADAVLALTRRTTP
ncbi:glycosyltransferase family 4 protein [Kineococcus gynurae]|uniref:Glycosyltransferase family 4 protein n=1 Tax=Kineococcus gynurae TaxID=452979 RepID=A0ABV5LXZ4_9ACTN